MFEWYAAEEETMERIPMTRAGYEKLKAQLEHLEGVVMPEVEKRVADARAEGDLRENAEYHGARETQGMTQAKINELRDRLNSAQILDPTKLARDEVVFGAKVTVKDLDLDEEESMTLVGAGEEDFDAGKISVSSPLAQGLIGHKVGEKVDIKVPAGTLRFEILAIDFESEPGE
jgi:transcription elongation factor GreA